MTDGGWWYYDAFLYYSISLSSGGCGEWMQRRTCQPVEQSLWAYSIVPWSLFTLAGTDTLIPNGLSVQPPHELSYCSENTRAGNDTVTGTVYSSCSSSRPHSLIFEVLTNYKVKWKIISLLLESGPSIKMSMYWANIGILLWLWLITYSSWILSNDWDAIFGESIFLFVHLL